MTVWAVEYIKEAESDFKNLDHSQQMQVLKAIDKVSENPLPKSEGGYGTPLGNHMAANLTGYLKIKLLKQGLRVVYCLIRDKNIMRIIIISVRDDDKVYRMAKNRVK